MSKRSLRFMLLVVALPLTAAACGDPAPVVLGRLKLVQAGVGTELVDAGPKSDDERGGSGDDDSKTERYESDRD